MIMLNPNFSREGMPSPEKSIEEIDADLSKRLNLLLKHIDVAGQEKPLPVAVVRETILIMAGLLGEKWNIYTKFGKPENATQEAKHLAGLFSVLDSLNQMESVDRGVIEKIEQFIH